ncbi:hypothetical protein HMPREF9441_02708 [Paraprevotella clara YIT 11840]|uniref:Uncharacterized protein n=1 Tax=Paraprevotella clara YIT 11840 TaxID=762968 RepID=G5STK3_9BACT|nr:hypothetical protein HMPREF9441_02708 [Paraprevotella clara YIT 11840]
MIIFKEPLPHFLAFYHGEMPSGFTLKFVKVCRFCKQKNKN